MKKILFLLLLTNFSLFAFAQSNNTNTTNTKKVAVYVTGEEDEGIKKVFGQKMVSAIVKCGDYTAVERTQSFLAELSKETSYQQSGVVSDNDIAKLGKQFGADLVCVVDITKVFNSKFLAAKLISAEEAEVLKSADCNDNYSDLQKLVEVAEKLANNLFGTASGTTSKTSEYWVLCEGCSDGKDIQVLKKDMPASVVYSTAVNYCKSVQVDGDGWRLPSLRELESMCDNKKELGGFKDGYYWSNVQSGYSSYFWVLTFQDCTASTAGDNYNKYVRCVRSK